jgi:hypothetical protein
MDEVVNVFNRFPSVMYVYWDKSSNAVYFDCKTKTCVKVTRAQAAVYAANEKAATSAATATAAATATPTAATPSADAAPTSK